MRAIVISHRGGVGAAADHILKSVRCLRLLYEAGVTHLYSAITGEVPAHQGICSKLGALPGHLLPQWQFCVHACILVWCRTVVSAGYFQVPAVWNCLA